MPEMLSSTFLAELGQLPHAHSEDLLFGVIEEELPGHGAGHAMVDGLLVADHDPWPSHANPSSSVEKRNGFFARGDGRFCWGFCEREFSIAL